MMIRKLLASLIVLGLSAAVVLGALALAGTAEAADGCHCPLVFKPVTCKNGQTYANSCYARCDGAKGCRSVGP